MTYDLDRLETLASDRKRWPTTADIGEMRHGILALITRIEELETENERLRERQESADLANEAIRWKRKALNAQDTLQRVRDARSNHPEIPECDRYTDDDTIKCGWRSAIEDIDKALEGETQ